MIAPARSAAYGILSALSADRTDLPTAIARSRTELGDDRDRSLAAEIATGVERFRATLDYLIEAYAKRPTSKLDVEVVDILRMSAYQLLYLSRVPASAVVNDAVALTKKVGKQSASGFVNAVLRGMARTTPADRLPPRPPDDAPEEAVLDYLSIVHSHPRWLAARWWRRMGFARAEAWMIFNNRSAPMTLRANRLRTSTSDLRARLASLGIATHPGRFGPDTLVVDEGQPLRAPDLDAGAFVIQDEASQLVTLLTGAHPGALVLDTCAAPGGKATAIAAMLGDRGSVVACDVRRNRMTLLERTVRTAGAHNIRLAYADAAAALPFRDAFATVIVDAPCSGLGTLRRDPDVRWRRQEADIAGLAAAERRILGQAAACVASRGRLIYATCSSEPEENEQVVDAFLRESSDFRPIDAHAVHPDLPPSVVDERGHLRTEPDRHGLEAFFGAVFERVEHL